MHPLRILALLLALLPGVALAQLGPVPGPSLPAFASARSLNTFAMIGTSREAIQNYFGFTSWNYFNQANYQDGQKYQLVYLSNTTSGYNSVSFFQHR